MITANDSQKITGALAALLAILACSAPAASAETAPRPWWLVTSGARPTYLKSGAGHDEVQELTVTATGGDVLVEGPHEAHAAFPYDAKAPVVQSDLEGAFGAGNIRVAGGPAAAGTGDLSAATGTGTLTDESEEVTAVTASKGAFAVGQDISGPGIPARTTITAVTSTTLTLSAPATRGGLLDPLQAGSTRVTGVHAVEGVFAAGQQISGPGIALGTLIAEVEGETLTLSGPATEAGTAVAIAGRVPYRVTFQGALSEDVEPLITNPALSVLAPFFSLGEELKGEAYATVATRPKPDGEFVVFVENMGNASVEGASTPVHITDKLPEHVRALEAVSAKKEPGAADEVERLQCSPPEGAGSRVSCAMAGGTRPLSPYESIEVRIAVRVEPGAEVCRPHEAKCENNEVSVSGGGARPISITRPITVNGEPTPFGVEDYELLSEEAGGAPDTQAGSHPYQETTVFTENQLADTHPLYEAEEFQRPEVYPAGNAKNIAAKWPPGLIGNPTPIERCTDVQFLRVVIAFTEDACPAGSAVGVVSVTVQEQVNIGYATFVVPLFNLEPEVGEPARFGFFVAPGTVPVYLDPTLRTGGDYGLTITSENTTQIAEFLAVKVSVWGSPGAPEHASMRGWGCLYESEHALFPHAPCFPAPEEHPTAFLSLPTSCSGPAVSTVEGNSWTQADDRKKENLPPLLEPLGETMLPPLDGCNHLPFIPEIKVTPDGKQASKPTGLNVDVHVPQEGQLNGEGLAQSDVRNITVKLPAGVAINPSSGDGLEACSEGLVGFEAGRGVNGFGEFPTDPGVSYPLFSPYLPGSIGAVAAGEKAPLEPGVNFCPNGSKVGEVTIKTPLLPADQPIKGFVYLAAQEANPFDSVLAMYIVAEDPASGLLFKLPGKLQLCKGAGEVIAGMTCEVAGQLVSTFENSPQGAFEDAELHFFGGERAPLATPSHCGTYTTDATFTPWSGGEPVHSSSSFGITSGPNGSPCPGASLPFNPSLTGGATNVNAGSYSPFTATMSRLPGEQNLQSLEVHLPPGLSATLSNVELCPEPQANEGECGPGSLIGETTVGVGVGGDPFSVTGGKFYITGPYNGTGGCTVGEAGCAPFGVTFVVPAKAGPFDFAKTQANHPACDCVLVRGKIEINPTTAAVTITSNPPGTPDAIPTILEGIPLEIQHVNAITTRGDFQFNPTNCSKMEVTGTIHSSEGGTDTVGVPFQVTNCAFLKFAPKFAVSTSGRTSRAGGASLSVKLTYPNAPFGSQANIAKVKVELPKALPSRLTTLQKACTSAQFHANPAGCPPDSIVGHAKAITPLLGVPLEGPAYFVSNGGEAFPNLIVVLQGDNVTIDLVGDTFINKKGITSSTFKTVPDAPVGSFELTFPQGKDSALAANGNLCKQKLAMPTEFVAQNGAEIHESTKIGVTGCAKVKRSSKRKGHRRAKAKHDERRGRRG